MIESPKNIKSNNIYLLRAIAVLSVIAYHYFPSTLNHGYLAVDIFFVISGFLISKSLSNRSMSASFKVSQFYFERIKRILPPLMTLILLCFILGLVIFRQPANVIIAKEGLNGLTFLSNYYYFLTINYFDLDSNLRPFLHLWSLAVEEQFYLFAPIVFLKRSKYKDIALITLATTSYIFYQTSPTNYSFYFFTHRAWQFFLGYLAFRVSKKVSKPYCLFFSFFVAAIFLMKDDILSFQFRLHLLMSFTFFSLATSDIKIRLNGVIQYLGKASYSLYLWHWPPAVFLNFFAITSTSIKVLVLLSSVFIGFLSFYFIEQRFNKFSFYQKSISTKPIKKIIIIHFLTILGISIYLFSISSNLSLSDRHSDLFKTSVNTSLSRDRDNRCSSSIAKEVIFIGDSHARMLGQESVEFGIGISQSNRPPISNITMKSPRTGNIVDSSLFDQCLNSLTENKNVKYIALIARLPMYLNQRMSASEGSYGFRRLYFIQDRKIAPYEALFSGYSSTIEKIIKANKVPIIISSVPEVLAQPFICLNKFDHISKCKVSRDIISARKEKEKLFIERLRNKHSKLIHFDPINIFCDSSLCRMSKNDEFLYADSSHLSDIGASLLKRDLLQYIKEYNLK